MLNQIVLVGRLVKEPELKNGEKNKQYMYITLAIPRSFKNINGEYDTDFIDCILWDSVAKSTSEYCHKGDIVGIWSQHMQYKEIYCILPLIYM